MREQLYPAATEKSPMHQRILARLQAQISWTDENSNERVSILGTTENLGESSVLINLQILPRVGSNVKLRLLDDEKPIIEIPATVIRVERNPSKPQAALSIIKNIKQWKETALTMAEEWVVRDMQLNYEGDDWLN